jgi:hypothetical protein
MSLGNRLGDERGLIAGLLLRLVLPLALMGAVGYEAAAVATARSDAQEVAGAAVVAAGDAYRRTESLDEARRAARRTIRRRNPTARLESFGVGGDGRIRLTVSREAGTLVVQHVEFLRGFHVARATAVSDRVEGA